ncbi:uncharacterized protein [Musca autumnalis]|uniref:uncharacterized protein n=1 Tax=Musca autumnalis TaxID=221902 RepID=UPI003CF08699
MSGLPNSKSEAISASDGSFANRPCNAIRRAIHLEIAADLSSDACLLCIRNFINRRGVPLVIRSDNGTNIVGVEKELHALGIQWKFNTPANPSEGGAWERLVQSVKKSMNAMLKEHAPRFETLQSSMPRQSQY